MDSEYSGFPELIRLDHMRLLFYSSRGEKKSNNQIAVISDGSTQYLTVEPSSESKRMDTKGGKWRGVGGGMNWEIGI